MKEFILSILFGAAVCCIIWHIGYEKGFEDGMRCAPTDSYAEKSEYDEWDELVDALIQVESEGNPSAISTKGAAGVLQLMPVFVKDANRIIGEEVYTLDDRFDIEKSIAMFNVVQGHYNPERDIEKAIRLHNPGAGAWYEKRVKDKINELKLNYEN